MKEVDSLIVVATIARFMAGVVVGMVLMALAAAALCTISQMGESVTKGQR